MQKNILFIVTNGIGLGHLTRGLAVAKRLSKQYSCNNIIFLTTSLASKEIEREGFKSYYIESRKCSKDDKRSIQVWNSKFFGLIRQLIKDYQIDTLVFDGAYAYAGLIDIIKRNKSINSVWIKREGDKHPYEIVKRLGSNFSKVIIPMDIGMEMKASDNGRVVDPIIFLDREEAYSREEVREKFQVENEEQLFYIQLGSGNNRKIDSYIENIIEYLLEIPNIKIIVAESVIGNELMLKAMENKQYTQRIHKISHYPNSKYFKGVDFAVSAAGYNTFHELAYYKVPTLYIPNPNTKTDDQVARAYRAKSLGIAEVVEKRTQINEYLHKLIQNQQQYRDRLCELEFKNGAAEAANVIYQLIK